jgi:hypothetical protein
MDPNNLIGRTARVTGRVAPGLIGEVIVGIRGGSECFYAYSQEPGETIDTGTTVIIADYHPPQTVYVTRLS